jgi:hypothetical protein
MHFSKGRGVKKKGFFEPFCPNSTSKLSKSASRTPKNVWAKNLIWVSLISKFDAVFESVEKTGKITPKKLQAENFSTQKVKNSIFFCHFFVNSLFRIFCIFYDGFEISIKFCVFLGYILSIANFCIKKNIFVGFQYHFW